jgi:hypothetical protein
VSYAALEWAFRQDLETISKFVLVVLADAANSEGICWPRIATIAKKTGVSIRTVQRALRLQARRGLITIEERYRPDGSRSSNRYRLHLDRGVSVSPPPDGRDTTPCHRSQGPPDTSVMSGTIRGTDNEPPLLQGVVEKQSVDRGGGDAFDLVYPGALLAEERAGAEAILAVLQSPLDQLVLDEWAGIIAAGAIRASPLGCLRELVKRARKGAFTPERALRVVRARETQQRMEAARADIARPELPVADENNPLVKRLRSLAKSQSEQ